MHVCVCVRTCVCVCVCGNTSIIVCECCSLQDEEDRGVAPPTRATYSAPADILNDIPPNELVSNIQPAVL